MRSQTTAPSLRLSSSHLKLGYDARQGPSVWPGCPASTPKSGIRSVQCSWPGAGCRGAVTWIESASSMREETERLRMGPSHKRIIGDPRSWPAATRHGVYAARHDVGCAKRRRVGLRLKAGTGKRLHAIEKTQPWPRVHWFTDAAPPSIGLAAVFPPAALGMPDSVPRNRIALIPRGGAPVTNRAHRPNPGDHL